VIEYIKIKFFQHLYLTVNDLAKAPVKVRLERQTVILLLILSSALLSLLRFDSVIVGSFFDDAHYIILAESLFAGRGYRLINFPDAPVERAFPPGWPLLLTPLVGFFPDNFTILKLLALFLWLASIPLIYRLFATRLQSPYLEALVAVVALNPHLVGLSGTVFSEMAYLFFSLLTLNLFEIWQRQEHRHRVWLLLVVIFIALYTLMVRTIGLTLLVSILLYLLLNRRHRDLGVIGGLLMLGLIPLAWFNLKNGGAFVFSESYQKHVNFVTSNLVNFVRPWEYLSILSPESFANSVVPVFDLGRVMALITPGPGHFFSITLLLLILLGYLISLRRYQLHQLYVALYLAIIYVWSVYTLRVELRLLVPLIPFLYFYLSQAMIWIAGRMTTSNRKLASSLTLIGFCFLMLIGVVRNYHEWRNPLGERVIDLSVGSSWISTHAPADSVIMAFSPAATYLYARRQTVAYPESGTDIEAYIKSNGVDYILVQPKLLDGDIRSRQFDEFTQFELLPLLTAKPDQFQGVYQNSMENVLVYEVKIPN